MDERKTFFACDKPVHAYGYEPQLKPEGKVKKVDFAAATTQATNMWWKKMNCELPVWWPKFSDGTIVTHLYICIDDVSGEDLRFPASTLHQAISHKLEANAPVNFNDPELKEHLMLHISPRSEGDRGKRPFLSTSSDLNALLREDVEENMRKTYGRIDLIALWKDEKLTEN